MDLSSLTYRKLQSCNQKKDIWRLETENNLFLESKRKINPSEAYSPAQKRQQKDKVVTPTMTGKANLSYQSVRSSRRSLIRKATCKGKRKQTQKAQKRTVVSDLHKRKQERRTPESFFQPECEPLSSPLALILLVLVSFYVNVMELTVMLQQFGYLRV